MVIRYFHNNDNSNDELPILKCFWEWLGMTPEEYACNGPDLFSDKAEFNFPGFADFYPYCENILSNDTIRIGDINSILVMMALDNETEDILDLCCDILPDEYLDVFVLSGIHSIQPNTRWQIAELIRRRKPLRWQAYLGELLDDCHPYVRQRARNSLEYLESESKY